MDLPVAFKEKYRQLLGEDEAEALFASFDTPPVKGFRLNPLKPHYQDVAVALTHPLSHVVDGYEGRVHGHTLMHQAGYVYSQDPSAMYVAAVTNPQPGERVLDLCAAPGGKTTQLAGMMANQGVLVSNEINTKRARVLAENVERTGARNVLVLNERPDHLATELAGYFDKVVVDAPCSGEGMFRKDPTAVKYWHTGYPAECARRQHEILRSAMALLRPGGQLVYSTCTYAPEEDEQVVAWLLREYGLMVMPLKRYPGMDAGRPDFADEEAALAGTVRMMTHHFAGEGQFVAKLQDPRPAVSVGGRSWHPRKKKSLKVSGRLNKEQLQLWTAFQQETLPGFIVAPADLYVSGTYLYLYRHEWPALNGLTYQRPGLLLGTFKKKRFEPSYALALALRPEEVAHVLAVSEAQWAAYVSGQVLSLDEEHPTGWTLLTCAGKPFAFGKVVGRTVKNFFPKALRFTVDK
ncbi:RsmB/NOP family class I SAM-dependent RNA methyltransferase [Ligilactobacillus sp. LYQ60]|uniref:RsmB/NOP family class I SAM-dependent RNA methyltransferase n=1 Tax=unclassified Ligilactobacillus TaxID=2767920 RepID=UPI0038545700